MTAAAASNIHLHSNSLGAALLTFRLLLLIQQYIAFLVQGANLSASLVQDSPISMQCAQLVAVLIHHWQCLPLRQFNEAILEGSSTRAAKSNNQFTKQSVTKQVNHASNSSQPRSSQSEIHRGHRVIMSTEAATTATLVDAGDATL
jgi:hypothetical protein